MFRGLATAVVALLLASSLAGCGGSKATAAPSGGVDASPIPSALPAGSHTTNAFQPATTYTVGTGWAVLADAATYFNLAPIADTENGLHMFRNPSALSQAVDCPASPQAGVGTSSVALVAWIRSLKGLTVSQPALATISGYPATSIDVSIAPGWTQSCPFAGGLPAVQLFYGGDNSLRWVVFNNEKLRLYFVDLPNAGTVVVDLDSFNGDGFATLLTNAAPIVKSLTFAK